MADNFDLRKFLIESKLTENSRKDAKRVHFGQTLASKKRLVKRTLAESRVPEVQEKKVPRKSLMERRIAEARKEKPAIKTPTWDEVKVWVTKYGESGAAKRLKIIYPDFVEKCGSPEAALKQVTPSEIRTMNRHNSKMRDADARARERRVGNASDRVRRDVSDRNNREKNGFDNPMPTFD